ncbi:MAG: hypothetical protein JSR21_07380 [Proteobacteria bacterium]|nr:hypothetical protein [Pseudomonadota bacterium]
MTAPEETGRARRGLLRLLAVAALVCAATFLMPAKRAEAGCLHTAQLYSCVSPGGKVVQLYCIGSGIVQTCMDFQGGWILVAPHEVLSQVASASSGGSAMSETSMADSQVTSALATSYAAPPAGPVVSPISGGSGGTNAPIIRASPSGVLGFKSAARADPMPGSQIRASTTGIAGLEIAGRSTPAPGEPIIGVGSTGVAGLKRPFPGQSGVDGRSGP